MTLNSPLLQRLGLLCLILLCTNVVAGERGTSQQARQMLANAVDILQQQGEKSAFARFNDPKGGFVQNDLYIFVIDTQGIYHASGANPKLVGQSLANTSDAAGNPVGQAILNLADKIGYGIIEYDWLNRQNNRIEHKFTRIKKVGDYIIGIGFYLPESTQ